MDRVYTAIGIICVLLILLVLTITISVGIHYLQQKNVYEDIPAVIAILIFICIWIITFLVLIMLVINFIQGE
ncbi:MAG TPA: hypothetical protein ENG40_01210 [Thermoprotei archaeon]|nr:hypothetical protein [Thermoprotei archaeon]